MKKKKYLPVYKKWAQRKTITTDMYLCNYFGHSDDFLKLLTPSTLEKDQLWEEGFSNFGWGEGDNTIGFLLLLMAAMNNEL